MGLEILNQYFDKIYVVTLHRSAERQEKINKHFQQVDFEYYYGTDKLQLNFPDLVGQHIYDPEEAKKLHRNGKEMFLGQVACSLSHRGLYKEILEKGYGKVLILEDDFVPAVTDETVLKNIFQELPYNWELVYFGYYLNETVTTIMRLKQYWYYLLSLTRLIKWTPAEVLNLYPKKYSPHLLKAGFHNTTHAYAVSAAALPKLIARQTPVVFCADTLLTDLVLNNKLNAFITIPRIFDQEIFMEGGSKLTYILDGTD
jgi:glycosyl transferase family 25